MNARSFAALLFAVTTSISCERRSENGTATGSGATTREVTADTVPLVDTASQDDTAYAFGFISGATRLTNGTIFVADEFSHNVKVISPAIGARSIGRRGSGPGEFRSVNWVGQCAPDSVFVADMQKREMSVFDSAGRFVRSFSLPAAELMSCSQTGTIAAMVAPPIVTPPSASSPHYKGSLLLWNTLGRTVAKVDSVPFVQNRPLGLLTRVAVANDEVLVGIGDSSALRTYSKRGVQLGSSPIHVQMRSPTTAHNASSVERMLAPLQDRGYRDQFRPMLLQIPMPRFLPAYRDVFVDPTGTIWLVVSALGDGYTICQLIDPNGRVQGFVRFPKELRIFEVGSEYVLASYDSNSGEGAIVVYRLVRRSS